ncbi:hypothetical protein HMPREF9153_0962 [Cutibacterium avidum ATCC 25577]|uniref:Uncharacterized protein n=1 Tax=Cutibacterium avidum ATCC 25577 TaxID=997355 RepID=G4CWQ5_9ACTN|nr:hypothetical protein HMPREF9153_0962 [Cutibacterium avidum ATCC 25577]
MRRSRRSQATSGSPGVRESGSSASRDERFQSCRVQGPGWHPGLSAQRHPRVPRSCRGIARGRTLRYGSGRRDHGRPLPPRPRPTQTVVIHLTPLIYA